MCEERMSGEEEIMGSPQFGVSKEQKRRVCESTDSDSVSYSSRVYF